MTMMPRDTNVHGTIFGGIILSYIDQAGAVQALEEAKTALGYTEILAPFDGRVVDRFAEPGDTAQPGTKLLALYNPLSLRVEAQVREVVALGLEVGQDLQVEIPAMQKIVDAVIQERVPAADPGGLRVTAAVSTEFDRVPENDRAEGNVFASAPAFAASRQTVSRRSGGAAANFNATRTCATSPGWARTSTCGSWRRGRRRSTAKG